MPIQTHNRGDDDFKLKNSFALHGLYKNIWKEFNLYPPWAIIKASVIQYGR